MFTSGSGSSPIKIYFFKCWTMLIYAVFLLKWILFDMLCLYDIYNVDMIFIYVTKLLGQITSLSILKQIEMFF